MKYSPSHRTLQRLDQFAPFGSAIGAIVSATFLYLRAALNISVDIDKVLAGGMILLFLPYLFCTCTHRKYILYSPAGIVAIFASYFGSMVGLLVSAPFAVHVNYSEYPGVGYLLSFNVLFFAALFSFMASRYVCKRAQRKEGENKQAQKN